MAARKSTKTVERYYATGRRKTAVARVYLSKGTGVFTVNGVDLKTFCPTECNFLDVTAPLRVTSTEGQFDVKAFVRGGGFNGQCGALRLGVARTLVLVSPDYKPLLRSKGYITVDSRQVERKKYGLKKARKDTQFSKR